MECKCPKCTNEETPAGFRPISLADFSTGGLKNKPELKNELAAHLLETTGNKGDLQGRLKEHAARGAYYLTAAPPASAQQASEAPAGVAQDSSSPAQANAKAYARASHGSVRTVSDLPPSPDRTPMETRGARASRLEEEVESAMPRPHIREGVAENPVLAAAYGLGFSAVIAGCLRYSDYLRFMFGRNEERKLTFREWGEVTDLSLYMSQRVLNDYIRDGIDVSFEVNEQFRTRRLQSWRDYWPLGHHVERVRALVVDTCWPVPGYTSPHGTTHLQDATTKLVLAVCHLTKHTDVSEVNPPPPPQPQPAQS